jgi:hypothetical protein
MWRLQLGPAAGFNVAHAAYLAVDGAWTELPGLWSHSHQAIHDRLWRSMCMNWQTPLSQSLYKRLHPADDAVTAPDQRMQDLDILCGTHKANTGVLPRLPSEFHVLESGRRR